MQDVELSHDPSIHLVHQVIKPLCKRLATFSSSICIYPNARRNGKVHLSFCDDSKMASSSNNKTHTWDPRLSFNENWHRFQSYLSYFETALFREAKDRNTMPKLYKLDEKLRKEANPDSLLQILILESLLKLNLCLCRAEKGKQLIVRNAITEVEGWTDATTLKDKGALLFDTRRRLQQIVR